MNQCAINQYIQREGDADRPIKVSVIVPIYNAGDRIYKCLDTLVNQTLREIEIICVLDCPTDGTDRVVEAYAKKDDRIVIVRNEHNLHVSGSRNEGLKVARGEYIGFSDHDDYRELDMYEQLYAKAKETNTDVVASGTTVIQENGEVEIELCDVKTREAAIKSVIEPWNYSYNPDRIIKNIWGNIYRRAFLESNGILFCGWDEIEFEDVLFNSIAYIKSGSMAFVEGPLYTWHKQIESAGNVWIYDEEMVNSMGRRQVRTTELVVEALQDTRQLDLYKGSVQTLLSFYMHTFFPTYRRLEKDYRKRLYRIMRMVDFPTIGRYCNLKLLSKKRVKLFFFVLKLKLDGRKA